MTRRRLFAFTLQAFLLLIVFLLLYPVVLPLYEPCVLVPTNAILKGLAPPSHVETDAAGNRVAYLVTEGGTHTPLFSINGRARLLLYSNLIILPSLLLATQTVWSARLRLLGWSLILLVLFHVVAEIGWVRVYQCLESDPRNAWCRTVSVNLEIGGPLMAVVQWAFLTWRYWLPPPADLGPGGSTVARRF